LRRRRFFYEKSRVSPRPARAAAAAAALSHRDAVVRLLHAQAGVGGRLADAIVEVGRRRRRQRGREKVKTFPLTATPVRYVVVRWTRATGRPLCFLSVVSQRCQGDCRQHGDAEKPGNATRARGKTRASSSVAPL